MSSEQHPSTDQSMVWTGAIGGGIQSDIARRWLHYLDDFHQGLHTMVIGSTLFLFFAWPANAIAFGGLCGLVTGGQIGAVEMIVATAVGGMVFALFFGSAINNSGWNWGPIVIFTGPLYSGCQMLG